MAPLDLDAGHPPAAPPKEPSAQHLRKVAAWRRGRQRLDRILQSSRGGGSSRLPVEMARGAWPSRPTRLVSQGSWLLSGGAPAQVLKGNAPARTRQVPGQQSAGASWGSRPMFRPRAFLEFGAAAALGPVRSCLVRAWGGPSRYAETSLLN